MKMRNKRKAMHKKYAGAKKAFNSFVKLSQTAMIERMEIIKQWMKDNPLVFED